MKATKTSGVAIMKKRWMGLMALGFLLAALTNALAGQTFASRTELIDYLQKKAASRPQTITFGFSSGMYSQIQDRDWMTDTLAQAGIINAGWSYTRSQCTLNNMTYLDLVHCETEQDILHALQGAGGRTVNLRLSESLYKSISRNSFARMHELQGQLGMDSTFSYYDAPLRVLMFKEIEYKEQFQLVSTKEELKTALYRQTESLSPAFSFCLTEDLFRQVIESGDDWLICVESNSGILDRQMTYSRATRVISYSDITYYPGKRIVAAYRMQDFSMLTKAEKQLYNEAADIINAAVANSRNEFEYLVYVHDEIVRRATYTTGLKQNDTAYGALMEGRADCDGYADALYLLCNLAGMECHYQHGNARDRQGDTGHMWNGVKLGGAFYCTDVTWNDTDQSAAVPLYAYLNMGRQQTADCYIWNESAAMFAPARDGETYSYYRIRGTAFDTVEEAAIYINRYAPGQGTVNLKVAMQGMREEDAVDALMTEINIGGRYVHKAASGWLYVLFTAK